MSPTPSSNAMPPIISWIMIGFGTYLGAIATGLIPDPNSSTSAPAGVLFATAMVFVVGGIMGQLSETSRFNNVFAALLLAGMGVLGVWAAISPAEQMSGGIPFIPQSVNVAIGRTLFGSGAVLSFCLCKYAITQAVKSFR